MNATNKGNSFHFGVNFEEASEDETASSQELGEENLITPAKQRSCYIWTLPLLEINLNCFLNKFKVYNIDVLMASEIDDSFPIGNFLINGFSIPYRLNRVSKGVSIMLYIREDIHSNLLTTVEECLEIRVFMLN